MFLFFSNQSEQDWALYVDDAESIDILNIDTKSLKRGAGA
jgi:hypothetical protein